MAARSTGPEKPPGFISNVKSLYQLTQSSFKWLPFLLVGEILVAIGIGVLIGFLIPPVAIWSIILWGVTGLAAGVLGAMFTMTRLSTPAIYQRLEGRPGATGHVLKSFLGRGWTADDMPVGINPKTQEAVYRAVGRGGVVIVGEGARGRLTRLVNEERSKAQRVAHGVPVNVFYVGNGPEDIPISKLARQIKALPKAIDRSTQAAVIKRIDSVSQSLASLPIPKGIDPTKVRAPRPR
jgi:hypothetical protein